MVSTTASRRAVGIRVLRLLTPLVAFAAVAVALGTAAQAGSLSVTWDAVFASDLEGYRVYYGQDPDNLTQVREVPAGVTETQLTGLADCTLWYAAVRAYDTGGLESQTSSNLVEGYPRPAISQVIPASARRGEVVDLVINGINFDQGDSLDSTHPASAVDFSQPSVTVLSTTVESCNRMTARVQLEANSAIGNVTLYVLNADLSHSNPNGRPRVFGQTAFQVLDASAEDTAPPIVLSVTPAQGAGGIQPSVRPTLTFDEPVDPASVSSANVQLLDASSRAVAQASGSPQVSGSTVTIFPASDLASGTYSVQAADVADLAGNVMASGYLQAPGFTVSSGPSDNSTSLAVMSSSPYEGEISVPTSTSEIRVTFDRDMSPLFAEFALATLRERFAVTSGRDVLAQTFDSPRLASGGQTVVIELADPLLDGQAYATVVNLAGSFATQLSNHGLSQFVMDQMWSSRPAWRVEGGLESVTYRDPETGETVSLAPNAPSLNVDNTGVPLDVEFALHFSRPVAESSVSGEVFRLLVQDGRRYEPVALLEPIKVEDGGTTIVIRPAKPLPAGAQAVIDVRTGPRGVILDGPNGAYDLGGGTPLHAPFATEVSGALQDASLAVGN